MQGTVYGGNERINQEKCILEEAQAAEIEDYSTGENCLPFCFVLFDLQPDKVINHGQSKDQGAISRDPIHVEDVACHQQQCRAEAAGQHPVEKHNYW